MESWLEAFKGTMVVSSWQKPIVGATLNQTRKGAMIASLWKESAKKVIATIICCRRYLGSNCACDGTKPKKMHEPHDGASTARESDIKPIQLSHMLRG